MIHAALAARPMLVLAWLIVYGCIQFRRLARRLER
jgi:hypothetical protein